MSYGEFSGNPRAEWLTEPGEDRRMQLLEDFWYLDPDGRKWLSHRNSIVDGASIPAALWSVIGSPYTGEYRRASIVHDVACDTPGLPRRDADKMFYFACLAGGCSIRQARVLYAGVRIGAWAPHIRLWTESMTLPATRKGAIRLTITDESVQNTFREIAADMAQIPEDVPFEAVERVVDQHLQAKANQ